MVTAAVHTKTAPRGSSSTRLVLWFMVLLAGAEFVVRGPLRYLEPTNWNDLAQYYAASRLWLRGQNFAKPENFVALWHDELNAPLTANTLRTHIAPLPGALVLLSPLGALSWPTAKLVWLGILLISVALTIWALSKAAGFSLREPRTIAFVAGCLALAPFHTGIASANQTILVVALCALGIWAAGGNRDIAAGLLFGAACSMKPHIASFLVLYYLIQRRWRLFITAVAFTMLLIFIMVAWMQVNHVSWLPDYRNNLKIGTTQNKIDDFTTANPIRFMLINLQVPIYSFIQDAKSANLLALSAGALLILLWAFLVLRTRAPAFGLLALGTVAVIGLLPLYHRFYDASVLSIPLCWCASIASGELRRIRNVALIVMAPFLVPGSALLQQAAREGRVSETWINSWWWDRVLMPHQTWLLVLLSLVLLYATWLQTRIASRTN